MTLVADSARSDEHMAAHRQTMTARAGDNAHFAPGRCVMPARPAPGRETRGGVARFRICRGPELGQHRSLAVNV